jgi:hypothetical protein
MIHRDRRWIMRFDLGDKEWALLELLTTADRAYDSEKVRQQIKDGAPCGAAAMPQGRTTPQNRKLVLRHQGLAARCARKFLAAASPIGALYWIKVVSQTLACAHC